MATWDNLIDNVGDELALDNFKSTGVDKAITQKALNRTLQELFKYPFSWRVLSTPLSVTPVVGQIDYNLSTITGGKKVQDIFTAFVDTGLSSSRPMHEKTLKWYIDHFANVANLGAGTPIFYARLAQYEIKIAPKPANITDIMKFYIVEEFADLTDFTTVHTLPPDVQGPVEDGMLSRMYRFLHEYDVASQLKRDFEIATQKLISEDKNNPNLTFVMEGASFGTFTGSEYWKSPFN